MTESEYHYKINAENTRHKEAIRAIKCEFATPNDPYKVGDIIEDQIGKGRILMRHVYSPTNGLPSLAYSCENLTQKGDVNKREPRRVIYQFNIIG